jgi:tetratricopeptide (TPR) repeat protein
MLDEAIEEFRKAPSVCEASLAHAYAISGRRTEALRILNEILARSRQSFVDPRNVAVIYVGLGETDQALDWLEEAYEKRNSGWLPFIGVEPDFLSLHGHPRFEALLKKMGVPPTFDELRSDRRFDDLLRRIGFEPKPKSQSTAERQVVKQTNGKIMLAVLPFENMSRDPQEWFSDGMTDEMINYWTYFKAFQ